MTFVKIFNDTANSRSLQFETKLVVDAFMAAFEGWPTHQVSIRSVPGKVEAIFNTCVNVYGIRWDAPYCWSGINLTEGGSYCNVFANKESIRAECLESLFTTLLKEKPFMDDRLHADETVGVAFDRLPVGHKARFPKFVQKQAEPEYEYEDDEDQ
jgi:hypothetical protein